MAKKKMKAERYLAICKSPHNLEQPIFELHGTKDDKVSEGWLVAAIKVFLPQELETFSQPAASAFSRTSPCCIVGCQNRVEVGAHVTIDGKRLYIIPTCRKHNRAGALDKMKGDARLKRNTIFLKLTLPKGKRIESKEGVFNYDVNESPDEVLESAMIFDTLEDEEEDDY